MISIETKKKQLKDMVNEYFNCYDMDYLILSCCYLYCGIGLN